MAPTSNQASDGRRKSGLTIAFRAVTGYTRNVRSVRMFHRTREHLRRQSVADGNASAAINSFETGGRVVEAR